MTTNDIIVGQRYTVNPCPLPMLGLVFPGCGMRKLFTQDEFTDKHLVIIESDSPLDIGRFLQEGDNAQDGIWECLEPLNQ